MIEIFKINDFKELEKYETEWNDLAVACGNGWPMVSYAWVRSYLEHMLEEGESWKCLIAVEDSRLAGVFPIIDHPHIDSDFRLPLLSDILISKNNREQILGALLSAVSDAYPNWNAFTLNGLREDSPIMESDGLSGCPMSVVSDDDGLGSYNSISGDYKTFYDSLSSNHRRNLKKAEKKLLKLDSPAYRFLAGKDADPSLLDIFMQLEVSGYKSAESEAGTAIINSPKRVRFKRALMRRLYDLGWLEWHILEADGKTIAMQMAFKMSSVLTLYKISYDEGYSSCAPGKLLVNKTFERAYESGDVSEINWITDLPFHDFWNARKRPYYTYHFYHRGLWPYMRHIMPRKMWLSIRDTKFPGRALDNLRRKIRG